MGEVTTIKVKKETRNRLADLGSKRETYDQIINRLVEFYSRRNKKAMKES